MTTNNKIFGQVVVFFALLFVHPILSLLWFGFCMVMAVAESVSEFNRQGRQDKIERGTIRRMQEEDEDDFDTEWDAAFDQHFERSSRPRARKRLR